MSGFGHICRRACGLMAVGAVLALVLFFGGLWAMKAAMAGEPDCKPWNDQAALADGLCPGQTFMLSRGAGSVAWSAGYLHPEPDRTATADGPDAALAALMDVTGPQPECAYVVGRTLDGWRATCVTNRPTAGNPHRTLGEGPSPNDAMASLLGRSVAGQEEALGKPVVVGPGGLDGEVHTPDCERLAREYRGQCVHGLGGIIGPNIMPPFGAAIGDEVDDTTVVEWRTAGSSFGPWNAWQEATLEWTDTIWKATTIQPDNATYTWVRHKSGPPACILNRPSGGHPWSAGRTIEEGDHGKTAYFMPGYGPIAGAGGFACAGYGVGECSGICN